MSHDEMSETFKKWNEGELDSFLIEISTNILKFILHVAETSDEVLALVLYDGSHSFQAVHEMCIQVFNIDTKGLQQCNFVLNVTQSCLHHFSTGLNLVLHVIYEISCGVNGRRDLGIAALYLRPN